MLTSFQSMQGNTFKQVTQREIKILGQRLERLDHRFSIRTPICTRLTGRDLFASFIWDIVTNLPTSRN
jgi:hypothetical protein